ncbi:peroxiredoxin-5, mitochondrial-like isoform X2 [Megachile rotundata]|uniref:peroxiredoxin-5, mitochondrial-like isoform X2 n=1 Tax=Megachile rotundata TaxID=143995 RepID=UPI003FD57BF9
MPQIKKGDKLPNATLYEALPENQTNILELVKNKKAVIFGVPGAYVPGCSRVHLRGFIEKSADLRFLGFQEVICVAVNDPFVLSAWGHARGADDKILWQHTPRPLEWILIFQT